MTSEQVLRTGVLFKKGSGNGPFGRRNWKPRYFVLTPRKLMYYTYEDGELKGEVDLSSCNEQSIEVMPADSMKTGSSASTIWRIAINTADRRLLVAAGTELEMNDWVEQFLVAFSMNSGQPLPVRASMHQAHAVAPGAITHTDASRNTITDFQNFAVARKSVSGAIRASMGAHGGHEFRLSDEQERHRQAEQQRQEDERHQQELVEERLRQEELLEAHLRSQEEERRKAHEAQEAERKAEEERVRHELLLEEQRRLKREKHERERQEAERQLRELELEEQEKQHEVEIRRHFDETSAPEVEIVRRPVETPVQVTHHEERRSYHQEVRVVSSPARSPVSANGLHSPASASASAPRSSLIGDAKKEAMERQQAEHTRQREAAIKLQQEQMRQEYLQQDAELHARAPPPVVPQSPAKRDAPASDAYRSVSSVEF